MVKISEQIYYLENGEVLRMTEYDDFPIIGELCTERMEPYRQFSAHKISDILTHFNIKKYSISPFNK